MNKCENVSEETFQFPRNVGRLWPVVVSLKYYITFSLSI